MTDAWTDGTMYRVNESCFNFHGHAACDAPDGPVMHAKAVVRVQEVVASVALVRASRLGTVKSTVPVKR